MTDYICPFCGKIYSGEDGRLDAQIHIFLSRCGTFTSGAHYNDTALDGYEGWITGARDTLLPNTHEWWYSLLLGLKDTKEDTLALRRFMSDLLHAMMSFGTKSEDLRNWFERVFIEPFKSKFKDGYYNSHEKYEEKLVQQGRTYEKTYRETVQKWLESQV